MTGATLSDPPRRLPVWVAFTAAAQLRQLQLEPPHQHAYLIVLDRDRRPIAAGRDAPDPRLDR